jgi:type II restriction/modification system DNA methylase subunit YeeA
VLTRIKESGDIFFAESDRDWILDGATVHVSMIGFDDGMDPKRILDGMGVDSINANLTSSTDVTQTSSLVENLNVAFMGDTKGGTFDVDQVTAISMLKLPNPHGKANSDVIVPWVNGSDITGRSRQKFIIDFGTRMNEAEAAKFEAPFKHIQTYVWPKRKSNNREAYRKYWWRHVEARPGMYLALSNQPRFLCTPRVSKHRLFIWLSFPTLADSATFVFAKSDDYFFGILHSRLHEVWARAQGTQVRERESGFRYTPTTCFETFPFPHPSPEQESEVAAAAKELDKLRSAWLNPPEWTREGILEFPGSIDGPWARYVSEPDERGVGTVRYPRLVPKDDEAAKLLAKRTLTNLYNERPTWLDLAHRKLDEAVFAAYGWEANLSDDEILTRLLALNQQRAAEE